ncbi:hypothetical protein [Rickettsia canadensis]|uniref:Uncharacterized protein n=1 Tax=Rickettsia canadensis str. CA410 TaxID=1105107 RepID=A0ABM5MRG4_RICCA|nr:hypothetical protein [Rickettsia canadensis]AFB21080.1 hypothetical protein RCA_02535 [Rickettsia canadensis str. CA410]
MSQAFLKNAYEQLNEFKKLSYENIRTLMEDRNKVDKTFKCALFTVNNLKV